jgi:hypothetical protein
MRVFGLVVTTVLAGGGCDFVFGLEGDPGPCDATSFAAAMPNAITAGEAFSISRDQATIVLQRDGLTYQASPIDADATAIDLGVYSDAAFSMAPEGTSLFYTAMIEPPLLRGALRGSDAWQLDAPVPGGTFAGTPSADEFGPRRVLVKLHQATDDVQEYEDDNGVWTPVGDVRQVPTTFAPNLTPTGLTMVYWQYAPGGGDVPDSSGVYLASRGSTSEWFGDATLILPGDHRAPQLLGACTALYTIDSTSEVERYDRP